MEDNPYQPSAATTNPIGCVTSWVGSLFRARAPAYVGPAPKATPIVARVRGVVLSHDPSYGVDGGTDGPSGPSARVTLVVDDDETAATVLDALQAGATVSVLSVARCR